MDINTSYALWSLVNPLKELSFQKAKNSLMSALSYEWWTQGPAYMQQSTMGGALPLRQIVTNLFVGTLWAPGLISTPVNGVRSLWNIGKKVVKMDVLARSAPLAPGAALKQGELVGLRDDLKTYNDLVWNEITENAGLSYFQLNYLKNVWGKTAGTTQWQWIGGDNSSNQLSLEKAFQKANMGWVNTPAVRSAILGGLASVSGNIKTSVKEAITIRRKIAKLEPHLKGRGADLTDHACLDTLKSDVTAALKQGAFAAVWVPLSIVNTIFALHANRFNKTSYAAEVLNGTLEGITQLCSGTAAAQTAAEVGAWAKGFSFVNAGLRNALPYFPQIMYGWSALSAGWQATATSLHLYAFGIAWNGLAPSFEKNMGERIQSTGLYQDRPVETVGYYALMAPLAAVTAFKVAQVGYYKIKAILSKDVKQAKMAEQRYDHAWTSLMSVPAQLIFQHWLPVWMWKGQGQMLNRAYDVSNSWYNNGFTCTVFNSLPSEVKTEVKAQ